MQSKLLTAVTAALIVPYTAAHGYMELPAPRNALWRNCPESMKAPTKQPRNYSLMALNAGGPSTVSKSGYGVCGDSVT